MMEQQGKQVSQGSDGFAITSLVTGILTIITSWFWPLALILGALGITFGGISYSKKKNGMALAGMICGAIGLIIMIAVIVLVIANRDSIPRTYYY